MTGLDETGRPSEILFEEEHDGLMARCTAGRGSPVLAVVFSQVRVPAGSFGLSRLFARTAHACLFLNQPRNSWYRGMDDDIDRLVDRAVERVGPARVVCYGSSMGAWGALAAAARRPAWEAVAFAPDFRIGEPASRSALAGLRPQPGEPDLADRLRGPRTAPVTILCGLFDPYDAGVAVRLQRADLADRVRLLTAASVHEFHDHLFSLNVIRKIIATFARDPAAELAARGLTLPLEPTDAYERFADLAAAADNGPPPPPEAVSALGLPSNPGVALLKVRALAAAGRTAEAIDELARLDAAMTGDPLLATLPKRYRKHVPRWRIALLAAEGRTVEALEVAAEAAARFPTDAAFAAGPM